MKNNECFNCLNHSGAELAENTGWYHKCKFGIENEGMGDVSACGRFEPNKGFQIGGYYTHMHFEQSGECLELVVHGDGEFPLDTPTEWLRFHICDFHQIEAWVEFWGKTLRNRGWIK